MTHPLSFQLAYPPCDPTSRLYCVVVCEAPFHGLLRVEHRVCVETVWNDGGDLLLHLPEFRRHARPGLAAVADAIRLHACDGLTAADAAKEMGVSRRLAERLFKEATGRTLLDAIHARRLERAAELVRESATPLEMIPGIVGWRSATAFRERFRATFGMTMREMRRQL